EIQIPAWILDGGIVLLALYSIAVLRASWYELKAARLARDLNVQNIAAVVFATNLGTLALVFSYTPFVATIGVQFWFLTGCLHGIAAATMPCSVPVTAAHTPMLMP